MDSRSGAESRLIRLGNVLDELDSLDDDLVLYVPALDLVTPDTAVALIDEELDEQPERMVYLLEVHLVKDVLRVWEEWRGGREPTPDQAVHAILYYAAKDVFMPVE